MAAIGNVSATASVFISPESNTDISSGETLTLSVDVDSGADQLRAAQITFAYDPSVFEVISISDANLLGKEALVAPGSGDDGAGMITYAIASTAGAYTPEVGAMLTIDLRVKDTAQDGVYNLGFQDVSLKDNNNEAIGGKATGASVTIGDVADDTSASIGSIDFGSPVKKTSASSSKDSSSKDSSSSFSSEQKLGYGYTFGFHPSDYEVMERFGMLQNDEEWAQNSLLLENKLVEQLKGQYLFPRGKVISVGANSAGYLVVVFYEPLTPDKTEIDELHTLIDQEAQKMGIENVPVEFGEGTGTQVSEVLQQLLDNVQAMNDVGLDEFMNNESSLYNPMVLATAGKIPQINNEKECWQWYYQDSYIISLNVSDAMDDYLKSGALLSTGLSHDGYFEVNINEDADVVRKSLIDDVYATLNQEAMKVGINDVPVIFKLSNPDTFDNEQIPDAEEIGDEAMEVPADQSQQAPGFGFLLSILSMSIVLCIISVSGKRKQ